jgi:hypothetical protein
VKPRGKGLPRRYPALPKAARRATFVTPSATDFAMKVTVERSELLKSLGHVHRAVERRNTIPILANVLIRADR